MADDLPTGLVTALAQRYEVRRLLGRGGMASVYLAFDRKHHRQVALKVLLPGLVEFLGAERFLKEIEIAAHLTHPHILPLYDSGEADGQLYYVMPFVEGGSLRTQLQQDGRLTVERAMAIATPVADALAYAHRMGFVHRDIKPENILFSQGHPVVADFGIAKAVSTAGGMNLTRTGFPIGTPGYMSPEQAAGLTDLDARADVYSLAVVIYEMLVGEVPGRWPTEDDVRAGRFGGATSAHRTRLTAMGSVVEAALVRGLAVRHDQRTASPGALIEDLAGSTPPRRRFSGGEVQEIVKRASELEATAPTLSDAMTIGGVEALAAEVGIAPDTVRRAADSLRASRSGAPLPAVEPIRANPWAGGPTTVVIERVVEGELPESEYAVMVDETRRFLKNVGQVSQLGRSFSWVASGGPSRRNLEIVVSMRAGRTRITIQENLAPLVGAVYGGIGGGMGGGGMGPIIGIFVGALHIPPPAMAVIIPAWLLTTLATARTAYRFTSRRRVAELEQLAERLAALARDLISESPALRPPAGPRLR
ncbi:MAG TPA: serine/threonine-protein kinase [Gemmatimonadales bacterium]|nr:serine/threonine-protein kinase [Gemmatimonadales bacterium]